MHKRAKDGHTERDGRAKREIEKESEEQDKELGEGHRQNRTEKAERRKDTRARENHIEKQRLRG